MESRAKFAGHALHQILIVYPLGLLSTAVIFDMMAYARRDGKYAGAGFWMTASGLIGGAAAAVPGLVDYLAIPQPTRARRIGFWHGIGNAAVMGLFATSLYLRSSDDDAPPRPRCGSPQPV